MSTPSWRSSSTSSTSNPDARRPLDRGALRDRLASRPLRRIAALAPAGTRVALVGGAIRDALLGLNPVDLDLAVEGDFDALIAAIAAERGRAPTDIGDAFQRTHRFHWGGLQIDLGVAHGTLEEDLPRRDFTVNAMAVPIAPMRSEEPMDPCDGMTDLAAGRLRLTSPEVLDADPLRALRGVRYATSLPGFSLVPSTRRAIRERAGLLQQVAAERVAAEWQAMLEGAGWCVALEMAWTLGLAAPTLGPRGGTTAIARWHEREARGGRPCMACRLAAVLLELDGAPDESVARLIARRFPARPLRHARRVAEWARACADASDEALVEWAVSDPGAAGEASELAAALVPADAAPDRLRDYARRAAQPRWVSGDDLVGWGASPGPAVGDLLREAARGQVAGHWRDAEAARDWARRRAADLGTRR